MQRYVYHKDREWVTGLERVLVLKLTLCSFGTEMITIQVNEGESARDFAVYEKLIRDASPFVDNALKGPWRESAERIVCLPEFTGTIFDIYHRWLLTRRLYSKTKPTELTPLTGGFAPEANDLIHEILTLRNLSHLGHYLVDTDFTDAVNDAIVQCCVDFKSINWEFPFYYGSIFYSSIPEGSPTRLLMADFVTWTTSPRAIQQLRNASKGEIPIEVDPDFLTDVLESMATRLVSSRPTISPFEGWATSCKYHSHGDDKPCYRSKVAEYVTASTPRS